jgi:DNA-binding HxlR family transcriptional regulator
MEEGTSKSVGHIRGTKDACPSAELACEVRRILDRIADKWSLLVISLLGQNTLRFSELRRQIDGISQRMLTLTLRNLERDGLVSRTVYPVVPPKVEYRLTTLGVTLIDPIRALVSWTGEHQDEIRAARDAYDATEASADHVATKSAAS